MIEYQKTDNNQETGEDIRHAVSDCITGLIKWYSGIQVIWSGTVMTEPHSTALSNETMYRFFYDDMKSPIRYPYSV